MFDCTDANSSIVAQDASGFSAERSAAVAIRPELNAVRRPDTEHPRLLSGAELRENAAALGQWRRLAQHAPNGSAFLHPDVVETLPRADDSLVVFAAPGEFPAGDRAGGTIAAFLPKRLHVRPFPAVPLRLSVYGRYAIAGQMIGDDGAEASGRLIEACIEWLQTKRGADAFFLFEGVETHHPLWNGLMERSRRGTANVFVRSPPEPRWWIDFPEDPQDYWKEISSRTQQMLRRKTRKLEHTLTVVREPGQVPEFLEKAEQVSRRSWQGRALGVRINSAGPQRKHFEALARQNALRSYLLERDGEPLAFLVGVQWNGTFIFDETGYDSRYRELSPGTVLFFRMLQDLTSAQSPRLFDFGIGDGEHKELFGNRHSHCGSLILARDDLWTKTLFRSMELRRRCTQQARQWLKQADQVYRMIRRIRH